MIRCILPLETFGLIHEEALILIHRLRHQQQIHSNDDALGQVEIFLRPPQHLMNDAHRHVPEIHMMILAVQDASEFMYDHDEIEICGTVPANRCFVHCCVAFL